jgi:arginyl-tRNA synthetase
VAQAGSQCVASDLLRGSVVPQAPRADLATASSWPQARRLLAAELTASLAVAAGATLATGSAPEPATALAAALATAPATGLAKPLARGSTTVSSVSMNVAYAGEDAVRFWLARGGPEPDPEAMARHLLDNPAYAVRYAYAAAAAVLRWAGHPPGDFRPALLAAPAERALLDALSWLPERVAVAARRGRPDVFARYLEALASRTIDIMNTTGPTSEMLWLALAARAALGAGLGLLGITAPERI